MKLPSVTRILEVPGLGPDYSMVRAEDMERARARGSAVHAAIEADHYQLDMDLPAECVPYMHAYRKFLVESGHKPILTEFRVESARWRYCGHPDRLGWLLGKRALLDFKCMDSISLRAPTRQLAGYRLAWNEQHPQEAIDLCAVLQLRSDGSYRLHEVDAAAKEQIFLAAVLLFHERAEDRAVAG